ncbi:MAG: sigma factor-like helix-turn-helix DNA-binding protein [Cellulomonas sp.]
MRLAVCDNLTHLQIAERLDLSTVAVRSHLRESLCRLRATVTADDAAR